MPWAEWQGFTEQQRDELRRRCEWREPYICPVKHDNANREEGEVFLCEQSDRDPREPKRCSLCQALEHYDVLANREEPGLAQQELRRKLKVTANATRELMQRLKDLPDETVALLESRSPDGLGPPELAGLHIQLWCLADNLDFAHDTMIVRRGAPPDHAVKSLALEIARLLDGQGIVPDSRPTGSFRLTLEIIFQDIDEDEKPDLRYVVDRALEEFAKTSAR